MRIYCNHLIYITYKIFWREYNEFSLLNLLLLLDNTNLLCLTRIEAIRLLRIIK